MPNARKQVTCNCSQYKFPHRLYSGKCAGHESKPDSPLDFDNRSYVSSTQREYDDVGMKVSDFI